MKFLIILFTFCSCFSFGQDCEDAITDIRAWYKSTEANLKNCAVIEVNDWIDEEQYNGYTPEVVAYFDTVAYEIIKIDEYGQSDWYEETKSYYFKNGALYFLFAKGYSPGEMYTATELNITEHELWERGWEAKTLEYFEKRTYFKNNKVIRCLEKSELFPANESDPEMKDISNVQVELSDSEGDDEIKHTNKLLLMLRGRH